VTPKKLFKIGEVMRYSGLSRQTIHNYTILGIIREVERTESGHRLYDESVFERLREVEKLKRKATLKEIRKMLASKKSSNPSMAPGSTLPRREEKEPKREQHPAARQVSAVQPDISMGNR